MYYFYLGVSLLEGRIVLWLFFCEFFLITLLNICSFLLIGDLKRGRLVVVNFAYTYNMNTDIHF